MSDLVEVFRRETSAPVAPGVEAFARDLARDADVVAVLFYGSALRTGDLTGVLDFYVLTGTPHRAGMRGWVERRLWPEIGFARCAAPEGELHAKVATLPLATFARAAQGRYADTTVWTRFVQPSRLVHARDDAARAQVLQALAAAARTAGGFAAVLGPATGMARDYWSALFRQTYAAEWRFETPGRERQVLDAAPGRYDALLPLAWAAAGVPFAQEGLQLSPRLSQDAARRLRRGWRLRRAFGKPLNAARLAKAAFTTAGAASYAAVKLSRHTGLSVEVTPWRERHPVLAGLGVLWRLRRRGQADAR